MKSYQHTGRQVSIPMGVALGAVGSVVVSGAGAALVAALVAGERLSQEGIRTAAIAVQFLSAGVGAVLSVGSVKQKKLPVALLTGGSYLVLLLSLTALFFGGQYQGVGYGALAILVGAILPPVLTLGGEKRGKHRLIKKAYR